MLERAPDIFDPKENNPEVNQRHFTINRISDGMAFGHGGISGSAEPHILAKADEAIHQSGEILVPIDKDDSGKVIEDDGCGDGRAVEQVFSKDKTYKRSLNRPKVFGGSAVMTTASLIGTGQVSGQSLGEVFGSAVSTLDSRNMDFGAHTDEHASGENCGCGAIDKAPEALLAALKYEEPIRGVIDALGSDTEQLDTVYANLRSYVGEMPGQEPYSGRKVMDRIIGSGKVIKKLGGVHLERRKVFNMVRGYTVNQELVRDKTDGQAQAFAVDIWRLEDISRNLFPGQPERQSQAYLSELVYTLSIAAVLTKGDMPIDMVYDQLTALAA